MQTHTGGVTASSSSATYATERAEQALAKVTSTLTVPCADTFNSVRAAIQPLMNSSQVVEWEQTCNKIWDGSTQVGWHVHAFITISAQLGQEVPTTHH